MINRFKTLELETIAKNIVEPNLEYFMTVPGPRWGYHSIVVYYDIASKCIRFTMNHGMSRDGIHILGLSVFKFKNPDRIMFKNSGESQLYEFTEGNVYLDLYNALSKMYVNSLSDRSCSLNWIYDAYNASSVDHYPTKIYVKFKHLMIFVENDADPILVKLKRSGYRNFARFPNDSEGMTAAVSGYFKYIEDKYYVSQIPLYNDFKSHVKVNLTMRPVKEVINTKYNKIAFDYATFLKKHEIKI